jgi:heptosyltransferase-2
MIKHDKILVIQTAFLGDVILALPMVQTIKYHLPDSKIDFLCVPDNVSVLQNNPAINQVIPYDKKGGDKLDKFIEVLSEIRENGYDIVISPHRFLRSALLTYYSEAKTRIGFERNSLSFLLTHKVVYDSGAHEIHRNMSLAEAIPGLNYDVKKISLKPRLYPGIDDKKKVYEYLPLGDSKRLITLAPCSRWFTKQFPLKKTVQLVNVLNESGYKIALIGGKDDEDYCSHVTEKSGIKGIINLCGRLTPLQSYFVITLSKHLITVDSAAQHLGAASDTPIALIYGSTNSSFGFYPLTSKHKIIENRDLDCRPCTDHGRTKCPLKHFKCMEDIAINEILNEVKNLLAK